MPPEQSYGPNGQYDFIMNPGKPPKKTLIPSIGGGSSFTKKIIFIVGGGIGLIFVIWIVATLLGGGSGNTANLTKAVQEGQEIARVATEGANASRADIRSAAINTRLSLKSQQQQWIAFLAQQGSSVSEEQQQLLQNATTDQQLETAKSNNTFDKAFLEIMRSYLTDYAGTLQTAFNGASSDAERALLSSHFGQVQLLLEQLPKS